jgi:hypothetical protein
MAAIDRDQAQAGYAALIRRYFDACNEADYDKLVSCLPEIPWRSFVKSIV